MRGGLRVLVGPAGSGKTERILEAFARERREGGEPLLLLPSSHRVGEVRARLLARGLSPGLATIHTLETLLDMVLSGTSCAYGRLNAVEIQALVDEVVRRVRSRLVYFSDMGLRWGFSRVVARFLREAVVLGHRGVPGPGVGSGEEGELLDGVQPPEKARDLVLLLETYKKVLKEKDLLDESLAFMEAARLLQEGKAPSMGGVSHLLVDGFYDFTVAQWSFVKALIETVPRTTFSLLYDPSRPWLFALSGRLLERLKALGGEEERMETEGGPLAPLEARMGRREGPLAPVDLSDRVSLIRGGGPWGEVRWVAYKVASLIRQGVSPKDIGVVVRDLSRRRSELEEALEAWGVPFHITQHPALAEHPLVNLVVMLIKTRMEDLPVSRLVSLALSSLVPLEEKTRGEILKLVDGVQYVMGMGAWREILAGKGGYPLASHWMTQTLLPALEAIPLEGRGREMVAGVEKALAILGIGEEPVLSFFREAMLWVVRGRELAGGKHFTLEEFLLSLGGVLRESHYSPDTVREGVTVMGLLDGRQSTFAHLFFVGLHEGSFPSQVQSDPLLRDGDRERINRACRAVLFNLPWEHQWEEDRLLFYVGVTRARESLYLSYNARDEEGRTLSPSPFLLDLLEGVGYSLIEGPPPLPFPSGARVSPEEERVAPPFPLPQVWTPTHIEAYAQCPYAFFLRYVLGIEPFRVPVEEALSTSIGELYHEVLEHYEEARREGRGGGLKENLDLLEEVAGEVFSRFVREGRVGHRGLFEAEAKRHMDVLRAFVRWETEEDHPPPYGVELEVRGEYRGVPLGGRIDRVQRDGRGEWTLWDYKTGNWYGFDRRRKKGLLFQPYVYAYLLGTTGRKCSLFRYIFLLHMEDRGKASMDLTVSAQEGRERLDKAVELVGMAQEGLFPTRSQEVGLEETEDKCRYCLYRRLCRREDKALGW